MADTADKQNLEIFGSLAEDWWNPEGSSRLLHRINPVRLSFVREAVLAHFGGSPKTRHPLIGKRALDIGCGAGLVAEPLSRMGADVTGLDAGEAVIAAAHAHAAAQALPIRYVAAEITKFAKDEVAGFDLITCLEVVEHVADLESFLAALASLLRPDGLLIFSTPNRTRLSWLVMIAGAEKIARLVPEGGHDWDKFLTPDELEAGLVRAGLKQTALKGLSWGPGKGFHLSDDLSVNYIGTAVRGLA